MATQPSSLTIPLATTQINSLYGDPTMTVRVAHCITCSLGPLVKQLPAAAPELTTFVASPPLAPEHRVTAAAWHVLWDVTDPTPHLGFLQQRSFVVIRKNRLYLDCEPCIRAGVTTLPGGIEKDIKRADAESAINEILLEIIRGWAGRFTIEEHIQKVAGGYLADLPMYVAREYGNRVRDSLAGKRRPRKRIVDPTDPEQTREITVPAIPESLDAPTRAPGDEDNAGAPLLELVADPDREAERLEFRMVLEEHARRMLGEAGVELVQMLLLGLPQEKIARALGRSPRTIKRLIADLKQSKGRCPRKPDRR